MAKKITPPKKRDRKKAPKTRTDPKSAGTKLPPHLKSPYSKPGAPTMYKSEYCQMMIDFMAQGFSFEAFAGYLGHPSDTLNGWVKSHAEFAVAKQIARGLNRIYWEHATIENAKKNVGNANGIRFNMINRFRGEWTESHAIDITSKGKEVNGTSIDLSKLSDKTLNILLKELEALDEGDQEGEG